MQYTKIIMILTVLCISSMPVIANNYSSVIVEETQWFNTDAVTTTKTRGVYMYFFLALLLFGFIAYAEYIKIPILFVLIGAINFFFSIFIFTTVSILFGILLILISFFLMIRGLTIK